MEKKYLIIYSNTEVISCMEYSEGVIVATTSSYIVETIANAKIMLSALSINFDETLFI